MSRPTTSKIADRYTLTGRLGKGGMGTVWRAEDDVLRRAVAVKEVGFPRSIDPAQRESLRRRALREARAAARLSHPGVVTVYDAIEHDDHVYIVMELVEAPTLQELVAREGRLAPEHAARIALEILDVLEVAHSAGVVHRDVKPGNIMVPERGRVRLADFGIAAVKDDPKLTSTGFVLGSPKFMAPEQAVGAEVTSATDLWGLGVTIYFMLEGAAPFDREQPIATLSAIVNDPPRPTEHAGPLWAALDALLDKDPAARPTPPALRSMLDGVAGDATLPAEDHTPTPVAPTREPEVLAPPARVPDVLTPPAREPEVPAVPARLPRRTGLVWAALILVVLAVAAGALIAGRDDPGGDRREQTGTSPAESAQENEGPSDWSTYEVADTGASISHPPGWVMTEGSCDSECIDFRDLESGTYLRLDWQSPAGADAVAAWQSLSQSFGSGRSNYREIAIEPIEFKGSDNAALWEYTYSEGGADLHAYNLGVAFENYGFALNFQTRAENWDAHQELWENFRTTFEPPI